MRWSIFLLLFSALSGAQIEIAGHILEVEIADTHAARAKGLMGRTELPEGHGMLFVYEHAQRLCFWMKGTLIPLSIAFFDEDKICIGILDMEPATSKSPVRYRCTAPALYALEVPQGWFERQGIRRGDKFSFLDEKNRIESSDLESTHAEEET